MDEEEYEHRIVLCCVCSVIECQIVPDSEIQEPVQVPVLHIQEQQANVPIPAGQQTLEEILADLQQIVPMEPNLPILPTPDLQELLAQCTCCARATRRQS
jgi:hypothetical protein